MISSLIIDRRIVYPSSADFYSPHENYPEYKFNHYALKKNMVYHAVRKCMANAGLDEKNIGLPTWNPFRTLISKGSKIFVLCNFVYHRRENESMNDFNAKCTHGSVLRVLIDYLLLAVGAEGKIIFGNAPVQSCNWDRVLKDTGASRLLDFYSKKVPSQVEACDLRSYKVKRSALGLITELNGTGLNNLEINIDMGNASLLEELYEGGATPRFRSLDYNPIMTECCHRAGKHIYSINKKILEADVVFSVPKLKVHEKVGVTLGLKGCVGSIAQKNCLAHYRLGSQRRGGDEFQYCNILNLFESALGEYTSKLKESSIKKYLKIIEFLLRKFILKILHRNIGGGWAGNDTAWRMSLDIARILLYANKKGILGTEAKRKHFALYDGIVGGEGQGPLAPSARQEGIVIFASDIVAGDYLACKCMGIDPNLIPLIKEAFILKKYALTKFKTTEITTIYLQKMINKIPSVRRPFKLPYGWSEILKNKRT